MAFYLFSYGTLMQGQSRNSILRDIGAKFVKKCSMSGVTMYDYHDELDNYPVLLLGEETDRINGELYFCENDAMLKCLDFIEGAGYLYTREIRPVVSLSKRDTDVIDAVVYIGVDKCWERFKGKSYFKRYHNKWWKPTANARTISEDSF